MKENDMITSEYKDNIQINKTDTGYEVTTTWYERNYRAELHKLLDRMLDNKETTGVLSHCDINGRIDTFYLRLYYDEQRYSY